MTYKSYTHAGRTFDLDDNISNKKRRDITALLNAPSDTVWIDDPARINHIMREILHGDHNGVDWDEAGTPLLYEVVQDFFTCCTPKTKPST